MSFTGNSTNSTSSGNRSSIFETFHTPSFGDDEFEIPTQETIHPIKTYSKPKMTRDDMIRSREQERRTGQGEEEEEEDEEEEEMMDEDELSSSDNNEPAATLWMSCSPGRDSTDDDDDDDVESGDDAESSDDGLPLSKIDVLLQLAGKRFPEGSKLQKSSKPSTQMKEKSSPKKPLSAYALFYRDTQSAIKSQNPQASFGEISKIVASMWDRLDSELKEVYTTTPFRFFLCRSLSGYSLFFRDTQEAIKSQNPLATLDHIGTTVAAMWDGLDEELKEDYNQRAEENKTIYLKQLAEYCAINTNKNTSSASSFRQPKKKKSSQHKSQSRLFDEFGMNSADNSGDHSKQAEKDKPQPQPLCTFTKCSNPAVSDSRWNNDYCSSLCLITHCKDVFNAWVTSRQNSHCET